MRTTLLLAAAGLSLTGCGGGADRNAADEAKAPQAKTAPKPVPKLASCPFKDTHDWKAFTEGGQLKVIGRVDLMMAGFKPVLAPHQGTGGPALDLSLQSDPGAAVADQVRYQSGSTSANSIDIYCGGDRIQSVTIVHVG